MCKQINGCTWNHGINLFMIYILKQSRSVLFLFFILLTIASCDDNAEDAEFKKANKVIKIDDTYSTISPSPEKSWTEEEEMDFVRKNSKSDLDRFMFHELVLDFEYYYTYTELEDYLKTFDYKDSKSSRAFVVVDYISGKSPAEIEKILGKSIKMRMLPIVEGESPEKVFFYYDNLIEINFKNGISSYIKVNIPPKHVIVINDYNYSEIKKSDRHSIVRLAIKE